MSHFDPEKFLIKRVLSLGFSELDDIRDKWAFIRQAYMECLPAILDQGRRDNTRRVGPYILDWTAHLNEPEQIVWESIRNRRVVLYPQFPVFNFFLDFGNPHMRIAVEVDGKQHDPSKDKKRDGLLADIGWKVFRIPAAECFTDANEIAQQPDFNLFDVDFRDTVGQWLLNSADGVIQSLEWVYFADITEPDASDSNNMADLIEIAEESLSRHRLVKFPIRGSNFS